MATVQLILPHHRYDIHVAPGALASLGAWVKAVAPHQLAAVLADANVFERYVPIARQSLEQAGYAVTARAVPPGEDHKTTAQVASLYDALIDG